MQPWLILVLVFVINAVSVACAIHLCCRRIQSQARFDQERIISQLFQRWQRMLADQRLVPPALHGDYRRNLLHHDALLYDDGSTGEDTIYDRDTLF